MWLMQILRWPRAGQRLSDIADELNRQCVPPKRHGTVQRNKQGGGTRVVIGRWTAPSLCRLLQNRQVKRLIEQLKKQEIREV